MLDNAHSTDKYVSQLKLCFILGIQRRSGTNYLFRALKLHPHCIGPGPIMEDYVIHHSFLLNDYADNLYSRYDPKWGVETAIGSQGKLLHLFGDALSHFLKLQVLLQTEKTPDSVQKSLENIEPKILLTKTPSLKGINNFFKLFSEAYLLIIVRDGRAVVESGVRSFGWDYETKMRNWAAAAKIILDFQEKHHNYNKKFLVVKYEELFKNPKDELLKILTLIGLDDQIYNFDILQSLSITGSSETIKIKGHKVHWKPVEKSDAFNPIARFSNWDKKRHERFNWIAGRYMSRFGYSLETNTSHRYLYFLRNSLLDLKWKLRAILKIAKKIMKRALKSA